MKKCFITVAEKETIHIWSKDPTNEYGEYLNTHENVCLLMPKNISKYILNNIVEDCDYKKEELFEVSFKKVDTKSYLDTNIDSDISTELNNTEFTLKEVDHDYIKRVSEHSPAILDNSSEIFYSFGSRGYADFIIKLQKDSINNGCINLTVFEISGHNPDTKEPHLDWMNEYLKAYIKFDGSFHFNFSEVDNGYMYLDSNDIPKHIILMSEIYKIAKLHITDFMGVDK